MRLGSASQTAVMTFPANGGHPAHGAAACQDANKQLELGEGRNEFGLRETSEIDAAFAAIKKKEPLPLSYTAVYRPKTPPNSRLSTACRRRLNAVIRPSRRADVVRCRRPNVFRKTVLFVAKICLAAAQHIGNVDQRSMLE